MKLLFCTLTLMIFICGGQSIINAQSLSDKIELELTADKDTFLWGEDIWLEVIVKNKTSETIIIPEATEQEGIKLTLVDSDGNIVPRWIPHYFFQYDSTLVSPNGVWRESIYLQNYANDKGVRPGGGLLVGRYKAEVFLMGAKSSIFEFQVVEPPPEEKIVAQRIIQELRVLYPSEQIKNAKRLIQLYPNSAYIPQIYFRLINELKFEYLEYPLLYRYDELISTIHEFIKKYPNSPFVLHALSGFQICQKRMLNVGWQEPTPSEKWPIIENSLRDIAKQYPTERITRYVEKVLRSAKKWDKYLELQQMKRREWQKKE